MSKQRVENTAVIERLSAPDPIQDGPVIALARDIYLRRITGRLADTKTADHLAEQAITDAETFWRTVENR